MLLDRDGVQEHLLNALDVTLLDETAEFGDGDPGGLALVATAATSTSATATVATAPTTTTTTTVAKATTVTATATTTAETTSKATTSAGRVRVSHCCGDSKTPAQTKRTFIRKVYDNIEKALKASDIL
jgi:hypothetical protein